MKKLFITLLCVVMVAVFMPTMAFAAEPVCENTSSNKTYTDITAAFDEAQDGDTLKLLTGVGAFSYPGGKNLTLDLGGNTIDGYITVYESGSLTVKNGTVKGDVWIMPSATDEPFNSFTLAEDAKIDGVYGIIVTQIAEGPDNYGTTVNINGEITGTKSCYWTLGNIHTDLKTAKNPVVVNVGPTAKMTNVSTTESASALQMAGACVVTVEEGAEITGPTGIEVRAGNLIVNGGKITATASPTTSTSNGNGSSTKGAGIGVSQHQTNLPISVTVNEGEVSGYTALYVTNPEENRIENNQVTAAVNGGNFTATNDEKNPIAQDDNAVDMPITVTGGTFSGDVVDYVAPDASYVEGSTSYAVGEEAKTLVENAKAGETLTILQYDGEITVPEGVKIENETGAPVKVNGDTVEDGKSITTTHEPVKTAAKAATCTEEGNIEYWYCASCGKYYKDEACTKEIAKKDTVVAKIAHTYKDGKCTVCGAKQPVPETNDINDIMPWAAVMLLAATATGCAALKRREER